MIGEVLFRDEAPSDLLVEATRLARTCFALPSNLGAIRLDVSLSARGVQQRPSQLRLLAKPSHAGSRPLDDEMSIAIHELCFPTNFALQVKLVMLVNSLFCDWFKDQDPWHDDSGPKAEVIRVLGDRDQNLTARLYLLEDGIYFLPTALAAHDPAMVRKVIPNPWPLARAIALPDISAHQRLQFRDLTTPRFFAGVGGRSTSSKTISKEATT